MDVTVKVIIDEKEYERLLQIEKKYKEISTNQSGAGNKTCSCNFSKTKNLPLDEIVARNEEEHAVEKPIAEILPSITIPSQSEQSSSNSLTSSLTKKREKKTIARKVDAGKKHGTDIEESLGVTKFVYPWYFIGAPQSE